MHNMKWTWDIKERIERQWLQKICPAEGRRMPRHKFHLITPVSQASKNFRNQIFYFSSTSMFTGIVETVGSRSWVMYSREYQ